MLILVLPALVLPALVLPAHVLPALVLSALLMLKALMLGLAALMLPALVLPALFMLKALMLVLAAFMLPALMLPAIPNSLAPLRLKQGLPMLLYTYFERDKEETWFSPIREGLYNVDKNYASARGRQPYMEKDECETLTPATLQSGTGVNDITIAIMGVTGSGKSSFIDTITKADAEASDLLDLDNGHGRTAPQYAPETWPPSFVSFSRPADNFGTDCRHIMCFDCATNGEDDLRNDRMSRYRCPDEDNMSSVSSSDQESLFEYSPSPSESDTTTTVSSSAFQQELTHTNIEHMLAVLKAERGKCLRELRGFDAALETIDQLVNRKCPEPKECSHGVQGP